MRNNRAKLNQIDTKLGGLEVVRAIAALEVMAGHMRGMYFVNFNELEERTIFARFFYFLTGFGHQAVIVFFVLSGFLVGGSVLDKYRNGTWSWKKYLIQRITRLWIVLIPALFMTLIFDFMGSIWNLPLYQGAYYEMMHQGPCFGKYSLSFNSFIGNLFFLHSWITPIFGSNGPMWSLFNEFWYYIIFPLFCSLIFLKNQWHFVFNSTLLFLIILFIPNSIIEGFFAWVGGALIAKSLEARQRGFNQLMFYFGISIFFTSLVLSRFSLVNNDTFIAVSFCIFLVPLLSLKYKSKFFSFVSESSYSTYLFHFPFSLFIFSFSLPSRQQFNLFNFFCFSFFFSLCMAYCITLYYAFEYHTSFVRKLLEASMLPNPPKLPKTTL